MADPRALRQAFGRFLTGVTVVTARDDSGAPVGFTANSFTSVSLEPPLLLVCPGNHLSTYECFAGASRFGVSILAEGQQDISNLFASSKGDRFAGCEWDTPCAGIPLITGRAAGFVCDVAQKIPAGDHLVMIGQVVHFDDAGSGGLGYGPEGYFARHQERAAARPMARRSHVSVLIEDGGDVLLQPDNTLPSVVVPPDTSPMETLRTHLHAAGIEARIGAMYAVWDDDSGARHLVLRARLTGQAPGLARHAIRDLPQLRITDPAQASLLQRFALEHRQQAFGFYVGTAHAGDVLPITEGE